MKKYIKKISKILGWTIGILILLVLILLIAIQIPFVQNFAKDQAVSYLQDKIKTKVSIDRLQISFPNNIRLENIYLEQQNGDTLFFGKKILLDISLFEILNNKIEINNIELLDLVANLSKNENSRFNFDYIIDAFASDQPKDTLAQSMIVSLNTIKLDSVFVRYNDLNAKNKSLFKLTHFDTKIENFDLEQFAFDVPKINLDGLSYHFHQDEIPGFVEEIIEEVKENSQEKYPKLNINEVNLSNISINYQDHNQKIFTDNSLGNLNILIEKIDLEKQAVVLGKINLSELNSEINFGKKLQKKTEDNTEKIQPNDWKVSIEDIVFQDINIKFNDNNSVPVSKGFDYNHINIKSFNLEANHLKYTSDEISGNLKNLQIQEKSGLVIEELQTEFYYGPNQAYLKKLNFKTPQTHLKDAVVIKYESIESLKNNLKNLTLDINIKGSSVAFKDLLLFAPDLAKSNPFKNNPNAILKINSTIYGTVGNIHIPELKLQGIRNTDLIASANIQGLPEVSSAYFDIIINRLNTSRSDLNSILPDGTIPATITIPNEIKLSGNFKGKTDDFNTKINLNTSDGDLNLVAHLNTKIKKQETYNADIELIHFNLGKIIQNDSLGNISMKMKVSGKSFDPKSANTKVEGSISSVFFKKYNYTNLNLNGKINNGIFEATVEMKDPDLTFDLNANGDLNKTYPETKLRLNLDIADLEKLNLHAGPMKIKGDIIADIPTADIDYLNANVLIHNVSINKEVEEYFLDSIKIDAIATAEKNSINIKSQFINANIDGKYQLSQLTNSLKRSISQYYELPIEKKDTSFVAQRIIFDIKTKDHPLLYKLIPGLTEFQSATINGTYDNINDTIRINGIIPKIQFGTTTITNGKIDIENEKNTLNYSVKVNPIESNNIKIPSVNISGNISENRVSYNILLQDTGDKDQYMIAGNFEEIDGKNVIKILPENLILNYEKWNIPENNEVKISKERIYVNDFELNKNGNLFKVQSQNNEPDAPIDVAFENFEIGTITNIIQKENLKINGNLDGKILLNDIFTDPTFTSDLNIRDFMFGQDTIGNIRLKVDNEITDLYQADITISGQNNDVKLEGNYQASDKNLNLDLNINQLNLESIQGFTMGNLKESKGFLSGKFKITGNISEPNIDGNIKFNNIGFTITPLNSKFKDINENIVINNTKIAFDNFLIKDEDDNLLQLTGQISHNSFTDFKFDLGINADNFKAVNSQAKDNDLYYGLLMIDSKLQIKGGINNPIVDGNIKINKNTKFTIVLPQSDPSMVDREGIVEFVDIANPTIIKHIDVKDQVNKTEIKGIEAAVNIEIVKEAELSLVIDKSNGDYLKLKGEAQLSGGIDPSGKTTLTGRYEFAEGTYEMSFNFIKRKFEIQKGSYILWKGDPTTADINITAVYNTNVAPIDLLDGLPPNQQNLFKQKLSVDTQLKMKGELLKPEITFDIVLPEDKNNVSSLVLTTTNNKLAQLRQQQTELDKQVFALLLLNRFIGENPFSSEAGNSDAAALARQSASKILSQQLNNLAGDLIDGIEIDFDLESQEDYTTGEKQNRTDLNVAVSKRLLDDRLKVTVGSSFGLEGPEQDQRETNNIAGDVAVEYQLSKDGKYTVRAYRKNKYQVALQGQVIETGVAFIITLDYNKFRELFQRSQEKKNRNVKISKDEKDE